MAKTAGKNKVAHLIFQQPTQNGLFPFNFRLQEDEIRQKLNEMRRNESRSRDTSRQILKTERLPNSRSLADVQRGASEPQLRSVFKLKLGSDWSFHLTNEHHLENLS